ncbi:hypothetical protein, partial [Alistipes sp.]|uniref:hypothetical protein n=1 Tax=Alistipes sp. TaxID=1872444 RepID=UPI003AAFF3A0
MFKEFPHGLDLSPQFRHFFSRPRRSFVLRVALAFRLRFRLAISLAIPPAMPACGLVCSPARGLGLQSGSRFGFAVRLAVWDLIPAFFSRPRR